MATERVPAMGDKHVKVHKHAGADPDEIHIKKGEDEVVWDAEDATTIEFNSPQESPFPWHKQNIAAGQSFPSGPTKENADGRYKYTVSVGSKKNDPTVIVHN